MAMIYQIIWLDGCQDTYYESECESESESESEEPTKRMILDKDKNQECPLTLSKIDKGEKYCICPICRYNFSTDAILQIKDRINLKCPLCRCPWIMSKMLVYVNAQDSCF